MICLQGIEFLLGNFTAVEDLKGCTRDRRHRSAPVQFAKTRSMGRTSDSLTSWKSKFIGMHDRWIAARSVRLI